MNAPGPGHSGWARAWPGASERRDDRAEAPARHDIQHTWRERAANDDTKTMLQPRPRVRCERAKNNLCLYSGAKKPGGPAQAQATGLARARQTLHPASAGGAS